MQRGRFTEDRIIGVLRGHEAGVKTDDLCREDGISDATFYTWKSRYGGDPCRRRRVCGLIGVNRSAWQYTPLHGKDSAVRERMRAIANERRRSDDRRLAIMIGR